MGAGFELFSHTLFRMMLRVDKQVDHAVLQEMKVAGAEQGRLADCLGRPTHDVHDPFLGRQVMGEVLLATREVDQVLGEISVLRAEFFSIGFRQAGAHVPQCELAVVMVLEIGPVLLNVHLV